MARDFDHLLLDVGLETRVAAPAGKLGEHDAYTLNPPFKGFDRVVVEQFHGLELMFGVHEDGSFDDQDSIAQSEFSVLHDLDYEVPW